MAPIRVALVGLSASAKAAWAAIAHLPYLQSPRGQKHYEIVALLNSSVEAAESAKKAYNLPDVKVYGDPTAVAADPGIDLVVINTRADVHFAVAEPSVRAGKAVFVEWPLTTDLASTLRLTEGKSLPNSIVGLQGRLGPFTAKIKDILKNGTIGRVYNSEVRVYGNLMPRDGFPENFSYFADRAVGGHPLNIHYGHVIDFVHSVLGDWEQFTTQGQIQRTESKIYGTDEVVRADVTDYMTIQGTVKDTQGVIVPGALLSATFRVGPRFNNEPGLVWTINGEKGELRFTAPGPYVFAGLTFDGPVTIAHHDHATDEVKVIEWDWQEWQKEYELTVRSTAELYERYAEWIENGKPTDVKVDRRWPTLDDGVALMKEFDTMYKQIDPTW